MNTYSTDLFKFDGKTFVTTSKEVKSMYPVHSISFSERITLRNPKTQGEVDFELSAIDESFTEETGECLCYYYNCVDSRFRHLKVEILWL